MVEKRIRYRFSSNINWEYSKWRKTKHGILFYETCKTINYVQLLFNSAHKMESQCDQQHSLISTMIEWVWFGKTNLWHDVSFGWKVGTRKKDCDWTVALGCYTTLVVQQTKASRKYESFCQGFDYIFGDLQQRIQKNQQLFRKQKKQEQENYHFTSFLSILHNPFWIRNHRNHLSIL